MAVYQKMSSCTVCYEGGCVVKVCSVEVCIVYSNIALTLVTEMRHKPIPLYLRTMLEALQDVERPQGFRKRKDKELFP